MGMILFPYAIYIILPYVRDVIVVKSTVVN